MLCVGTSQVNSKVEPAGQRVRHFSTCFFYRKPMTLLEGFVFM